MPAASFDAEYGNGHWSLLQSENEASRYRQIAHFIQQRAARPRLLDAGCGSGELTSHLSAVAITSYLGVDLSSNAIAQAQTRGAPQAKFTQGDLETWSTGESFDVIVVNEVIGYLRDPAATLVRLSRSLAVNGFLVVSLYRWGNSAAMWRRIATQLITLDAVELTGNDGKIWDIRVLQPRSSAIS